MHELPLATRTGRAVLRRPLPGVIDRAWAAVARGHLLPLALLGFLVVMMLRHLLFTGGVPASMDSGFLYSRLPLFDRYGMTGFSVWLPDSFGQVQQYSVYWLLAAFNGVFHNPLAVYKGAVLATVLVAAWGSYGLAHWLSGSRLAATIAAGLYVFSPFSVAIWLVGHLDVGISYAVGPLALWALWAALRSGRTAPMVGLGLAGSALFLLTTGQGIYWLLPMGLIAAFELTSQSRTHHKRIVLRRVALTAGVSALVFVLASAVQLIPYAAGAKAPFVSGGSHYYIQQLSVHAKYSLPLQDDVLGVPQATRYLSPDVTIAASGLDGVLYKVVAVALLAIALAALATRRRRSALALLPAVLIAWLLASGPNGPIGPVYHELYDHLPFFSFLRVPNRWLMVSTLGLSMLTALTIASLQETTFDRERSRRSRELGARVVVLAACLGLFAGSYGLIHGLPTRKPPADYAEAYSTLRADHRDWRILTTPYYQSWMDSNDQPGFPVIYASDLGHTSTYWHAHPGLDRGGWDPRAARFATYLSELTEQGTSRSLTKLLGAVGVKYVGVDPHRAMEVVSGQNPFFERQAGLSQVERAGNVRIYRNRYALPQGFHVGTSCLISGGFHVLGDLAEQPSFRFDRVGVRFADQIAALNGRGALASALASSSCLILAPGGRQALVRTARCRRRAKRDQLRPALLDPQRHKPVSRYSVPSRRWRLPCRAQAGSRQRSMLHARAATASMSWGCKRPDRARSLCVSMAAARAGQSSTPISGPATGGCTARRSRLRRVRTSSSCSTAALPTRCSPRWRSSMISWLRAACLPRRACV